MEGSIGVAPNHPFLCSDFPWLGYLIVRKPTASCFILKIFKGMIIFLATRKVGQTHDRFPCWKCSYCSHGLLPSKRLDLNYVRTFFCHKPQALNFKNDKPCVGPSLWTPSSPFPALAMAHRRKANAFGTGGPQKGSDLAALTVMWFRRFKDWGFSLI